MESGKKSLEELTSAGVFHVPKYQRYYSWEESEWEDLWRDLDTLPKGKNHYFGTVIFQKTDRKAKGEKEEGYGGVTAEPINELIDGQQRLTSLVLLTKSMVEHLRMIGPETNYADAIQDDVAKMQEALLVNDGIHFIELLDERDSEFLKRIVDGQNLPDPERQSQRRMRDAKEYFDKRINRLREERSLIEVANKLNRLWETILDLEIMAYVIEAGNPEKATLIFDSVNDRGRDLSTLDKTKSFLMRTAYLVASSDGHVSQVIDIVRRAFGQMYDQHQRMIDSPYVEDVDDDAVQRYHFITFFDWSQRQDHLDPAFLDRLKRHVRGLRIDDQERPTDQEDECLSYVQEYTESLEKGFQQLGHILSYREDDEVANLIDRVHKLRHATKFYPLLIKAWGPLSKGERRKLLKAIETYIFRVYAIGNHPTYTGRSSLFKAARDIEEGAPLDKWIRELTDIMNSYEDDSQFRRTLSSPDLYTDVASKDLRYLFYFYNRRRARQKKERGSITLDEALGSDYTIEHIWPQDPDELPFDDSGEHLSVGERYEAYKHRLGNLTLASKAWNSKWGNKDFATKRDAGYNHSKLWVQADLQQYKRWSIDNIEDREDELAEFALKKWSMPQL